MQIMHFILDKILKHAFLSLVVAKLFDLKNSPVFGPPCRCTKAIASRTYELFYPIQFSNILLTISTFYNEIKNT